jgi:hypothetical protein
MTEPSINALLASAGVAFVGVVQQMGASTMPEVDADERTAVIRVEQVVKAPPAVALLPGTTVTMRLAADQPPPVEGERAAFFADGWVYAESVALAEVERQPAAVLGPAVAAGGPETAGFASEDLLGEVAQEQVLAHAREAAAVVRGRVVSLAEITKDLSPREHDPIVWAAVLTVDLVAKGDLGGGDTVSVAYANSQDVRWRDALKPKAGQGGLWLLHPPQPDWPTGPPFCVLHSIDLQPSVQLDFLRERGL